MTRVRLRPPRAWWTARVRPGDDRGSLVFALLASFIGMALAAVLTPIIVSQWTATTADDNHASALGAAQAGLEVAYGQINGAANLVAGTRVGDITQLPCGPLTGGVNSGTGSTYSVKISYFANDPSGRYFNATDAAINAAAIPCTSGSGTAVTPGFALLRSAQPTGERVVFDGKYVTAAGVSSGIDMGLTLLGRIAGDEHAQAVQLLTEYDPQPPYDAGSPDKAPAHLVAEFRTKSRFILT